MRLYRILWGHSGTYGREWTTAQEASRYAAIIWGVIEAVSAEAAAQKVISEMCEAGNVTRESFDWYSEDSTIHVVQVDL